MDSLRPARYDVAAAAALLAEPSRVAMLFALIHGEARPASELARLAGVSAATASSHLSKLVAGGMIRCEPRGRGRFFSLASEDVAVLLEVLVQRTARPVRRDDESPLALARTCYRHLAGRLGTQLAEAMRKAGELALEADAWSLTVEGRERLRRAGFLGERDSCVGRACLDWTERRPHVGGSLGRALADGMLARRWVVRLPDSRALRVTDAGRKGLEKEFGLRW